MKPGEFYELTPREFQNYVRGRIEKDKNRMEFMSGLILMVYNIMGQVWAKDFHPVNVSDVIPGSGKGKETRGMSEREKIKADRKKMTEMMSSDTGIDNRLDRVFSGKQEVIRRPKR